MSSRRQFLAALAAFPLRAAPDPWSAAELLEPAEFVQSFSTRQSSASILYVGFPVLYRAAHIANAKPAGPCSKAEGLAALRTALDRLPRERPVVLYCGCCPFDQCPNIRPAYLATHKLGFSHIRVLHLPTNLHTDWIAKGYPVEQPANARNSLQR